LGEIKKGKLEKKRVMDIALPMVTRIKGSIMVVCPIKPVAKPISIGDMMETIVLNPENSMKNPTETAVMISQYESCVEL
jgi:hypothetical protein